MHAKENQFQQFETHLECPMCGGAEIELYDAPHVRKCIQCRLFFHSPCPTQEDIKKSYDSGTTYEGWSHCVDNHVRQFQVRLRHILPHARGGKLLDVGLGSGLFLKEAAKAGFDVEGTELSSAGFDSSERLGFPVHQGQLTDIDFGSRKYKVVTMWHVLEHVPNPGDVIRKIYGILEPGGIFALAVPNETKRLIQHRLGILDRSHPVWWWAWGSEIHLNHFFPRTLRKHLQLLGFEIVGFGMDDVYPDTRLRSRVVIGMHTLLSRILGWHFGQAMYFVTRKT